MELSKQLEKSIDIITGQPQILVPYIIPAVIGLIALWVRITNIVSWGITRLYPLGRGPLEFFTYFVRSIQFLRVYDWVIWIIVLAILAVCVALTIVMADAHMSGSPVTLGSAFDAVGDRLIPVIIAFLISWVLKFFGMFFFWVGVFVPSVLLVFVGQGILLDNKDLFDSFSNSYDKAKETWGKILVVLFAFVVILAVVRSVLFLSVIVSCFLMGYSAVLFTVMYRDRSIIPK
ncbi:MAG: hypothetical protein PVF58_09895 [Candidatus Methanofastidiosia archaeon]|jgi:hypothetical protein